MNTRLANRPNLEPEIQPLPPAGAGWRRLRWLAAALILTVSGGLSPGAPAADAPRPHIVFILADDLGWGDLACYGHPQVKTPHLDRLARQGTLFTQFYVNGSVCSPTRAAFLTGQFPARHAIHGHFATPQQNQQRAMPNWLDATVVTLPKLLQQAGYATAHIGKWHLGSGPNAPAPSAYGFDHSRALNANGPTFGGEKDEYFRARSTDLFVDEAIGFLEANRDKPCYVQIWTLLTHATLHPTEEQMAPYRQFAPAGVPYQGTKMIYYASVTALDAAVGRLLAKLDELRLAENTLVFFTSDNGPEDLEIGNAVHSGIGSAGPLRGRKRSLYEGGVRVPGIVRWPGRVPAGRVDDQSVWSGADWLPTVCRLAGVRLPDGLALDGEDVSDVLLGRSSRPREKPLLWEWRTRIIGHVLHRSPMLAIREGDWKLLLNPDRSRVELYRIPADASELNNLAGQHPELVERLAGRALAWQQTLPPGPSEPEAGRNSYRYPKGAVAAP